MVGFMICKCGNKETVTLEQAFKNGTIHIRIECKSCKSFLGYQPSVSDEDFAMPYGKYKDYLLNYHSDT